MAKKVNKKPIPQTQAPAAKPAAKTSASASEPAHRYFEVKYLCLALGLLSFIIYFNTLWNGYVLDDVMVLKENTMVMQGTKAIGELLSTPHMRGYLIIPNDMWRPLSLVMFAIEYQFFGPNPMVGHFFNVVVFCGCVIMFFLFLIKFFDGKKTAVAFIAALIFAVHPIHTDVVANIKSRDELLCFFFAFLSLNYFMSYMKSGKMLQLVLGIFIFFLSLMSKETVVTFAAIIPLLFFFYNNQSKQRALFITAGSAAALITFVLIRASILNTYNANQPAPVEFIDNALAGAPDAIARFTTEFVIMGKYLKLMFIPYPLLCNYSYNAIQYASLASIWFWLSLAAYGAMIWFAITRWIKNKKDPWTFGIVFYLATLSLFSNFPFLMGAEMAERFAFFASAGICLLMALAIEQWIIKAEATDITLLTSTRVMAVLVPLCLLFSGMTIARNFDWATDYKLFKTDVEKSPNDSRLYHYVATAIAENVYPKETDSLKKKELDEESLNYLRKSLAIYPTYSEAHIEMGRIFDRQHKWDSAEYHDLKAFELNPNNATACNNLGSVYLSSAKYQKAVELFQRSIALNPNFKYPYFNSARAYVQLQKYDSAVMYFNKMLQFDPTFVDAHQEKAMAFFQMQKFDSAEAAMKYVVTAKPNDAAVANTMGAINLNTKRYPQAIEWFKKSISLDPNYYSAYSNLGRAYFFTQQYDAAIQTFNKEFSLDPKNGRDVPYVALSYQKKGDMENARKYEAIAKQIYSNFKLE
jgi:protein O-mannosyl-transferase